MRDLDPRVKLLWMVICTTGALVFYDPIWMMGLACFSLVGTLVLGADLKSFIARFRHFLGFLSFVVLLQVIFNRSGAPVLSINSFVLLYSAGLNRGIIIALRYFVILCAASVMVEENNLKVIAALTQMGIPYTFSFMLLTALRFLPLFRSSFSNALVAIQLRGVELNKIPWNKRLYFYSSLILPVVADAVVRAQQLATVMEARGFGALPQRTSYVQVAMKFKDWTFAILLFGLCGFAFKLYYFKF